MIVCRKILCVILIISVTGCYSVSSISKEKFESNKDEYNLYSVETLNNKYSLKDDNLSMEITSSGILVRIKTINFRTIPISEIAEFVRSENKLLGVKTINSESLYASDSLSFATDRNGLIVKTTSTQSKVIPFDEINKYEYEYFNFINTALSSIVIFVISVYILGSIVLSGLTIKVG